MMLNRRELIRTTVAGSAGLAFTPSFSHLLADDSQPGDDSRSEDQPPHRFVFIRKSNGNIPAYCTLPSLSDQDRQKDQQKESLEVDLEKHELPGWLQQLDEHRSHMTILHGISMCVSGGGHYSFSGCMGAYKAGRNVLSGIKRTTVDFELAKLFPSPFGHVEVSLASAASGVSFRQGIVSGFSAPAAHQRNYCYADPMTAYNELFKSVTNTAAVDADNTLLDYLREQEGRRLTGLNGKERRKISGHVDSIESIRERNAKVAAMSSVIAENLPSIDSVHENGGTNATLVEKQSGYMSHRMPSLCLRKIDLN